MSDVLLTEQRGSTRILTFNRPERLNAWTGEMGRAYFDALDDAAADPDVRAIVVTGAGRGFCAGADMDMLQGISGSGGEGRSEAPPDTRPHTHAISIGKPVVAAINGACAGLGLVHAAACDIRFAAEGAKFTTAFVRRGLIAEHSLSWTLPRIVGPSNALDLLFSGRVFLADEARELGFVSAVVSSDQLLDHAVAYTEDLAANCSPTSMKVMKYQVWQHLQKDLDAALEESNRLMAESLRRPDFKEGVASFVEKRPPDFEPVTQS
jgi:enoyl-CoA hydratase/carnithine racemase